MSDTNVYQRVKLHINNAGPGERIMVYVSKADTPVAWSLGPAFTTDGGIKIIAGENGMVPLSNLAVDAEKVAMDIHVRSVRISFVIDLYLVAQTGIQSFKLKHYSDSGPSVHVSLGDADPKELSYTFVELPWSS